VNLKRNEIRRLYQCV